MGSSKMQLVRLLIGGLLINLGLSARLSLASHPASPCPGVFTYEGSEPEYDKWYGGIVYRSNDNLVGVRLDIELDRRSDLMVAWFQSWTGELSTSDSIKYTILNLNQRLKAGSTMTSRIMVKFNPSIGSPRIRSIKLNNRQICPKDSVQNSEYQESVRPPTVQNRPDPVFVENSEDLEYNNNKNNNNNNNYHNNYNHPSPVETTEEPYTTTRRSTKMTTTTTTTRTPVRENTDDSRPPNKKNNNVNANLLTLQASTIDSNSDLNGVINGFLQNENNTNKTVIITVVEKNPQNRPTNTGSSGNSGSNSGGSSSGNSESRPNLYGGERPSGQKSTTTLRPNYNYGEDTNSAHSEQSSDSDSETCGIIKLQAVPLITYGQSTLQGQWPWHVALFRIEGANLNYNCGGSLVAKNKVITAAHCVFEKNEDSIIQSKKLVIYLGKHHRFQYSDELGIQTKQVSRINVFPAFNKNNFTGDLAILTLSSNVEYTKYVTPVCLWDESDSLDNIVNKEGTVVGWGYDENDTPTEELKMAKMPVVSHETCLWSNPNFYSEFSSNKTFCAGFRNGTSVCTGDSGGGMVFNKNSRWYLRGIVSLAVPKEGLRICDTKHYVVFTDVAKYMDFVRKNIDR